MAEFSHVFADFEKVHCFVKVIALLLKSVAVFR